MWHSKQATPQSPNTLVLDDVPLFEITPGCFVKCFFDSFVLISVAILKSGSQGSDRHRGCSYPQNTMWTDGVRVMIRSPIGF